MEPRGSGWCEAGAWDTRGFSSLLSPWKLQNKGKLCKTHCTRTLVPNRHVVRPAKALAPGERDLVSVRSFSAHGGCPSRSCVLPGVSSSAGAVQRPGGSPPRPPPPGLSPAPRWLSEGQRGTGSLLQEPAAPGKALAAQGAALPSQEAALRGEEEEDEEEEVAAPGEAKALGDGGAPRCVREEDAPKDLGAGGGMGRTGSSPNPPPQDAPSTPGGAKAVPTEPPKVCRAMVGPSSCPIPTPVPPAHLQCGAGVALSRGAPPGSTRVPWGRGPCCCATPCRAVPFRAVPSRAHPAPALPPLGAKCPGEAGLEAGGGGGRSPQRTQHPCQAPLPAPPLPVHCPCRFRAGCAPCGSPKDMGYVCLPRGDTALHPWGKGPFVMGTLSSGGRGPSPLGTSALHPWGP